MDSISGYSPSISTMAFVHCGPASGNKVVDSKNVKNWATLFVPGSIKKNEDDEIVSGKLKADTIFHYRSKLGKPSFVALKKGTEVNLADGIKGTLAEKINVDLGDYSKSFSAGKIVDISHEGVVNGEAD